ncbi:MAG: cation:proton antiporter [Pseudomonadota bacterium]
MLLGLAAQAIGSRTHVPRVTMLILLGIGIGPVGLDLLPDLSNAWFDYITTVALTMIGFLLGGKLDRDLIGRYGSASILLSLVITLGTFATVLAGLLLIGVSVPLALILAGVSLATDPIATLDVVNSTPGDSRLKRFLPGIVALDDVWGLLLFSVVMTFVHLFASETFSVDFVHDALLELGGSIALGAGLGLPMALLSGRIKEGEPTLLEAVGMVMLCAGLSLLLGASYLLASIVMGMMVSWYGRHHKFAFHEIEHIEWPFLLLFLILVGASFEPSGLAVLSVAGLGYIVFRVLGRVLGCHLYLPHILSGREKTYLGFSLLPQAGVALGTAIYAKQLFPDLASEVVMVTIGATIFFELVGPVFTALGLRRTAPLDSR